MAFHGEYSHTIDAKGRTFLPAKLRESLGTTVIIAQGLDKCLTIYPLESWKKFEEKVNDLPPIQARRARRWIYGFSQDTDIDSQGRVLIPDRFVKYAGFEKNIISLGVGDHIEVWSENGYREMLDDEEMDPAAIAQALIDSGM